MTTTTDTDDTNPRLAALEADVRNINTQLERMHADQQESRREHAADIRQVNTRLDQLSAQLNARLDQLSARIDRLTYLIMGGIITMLVGIALLYFRIGP